MPEIKENGLFGLDLQELAAIVQEAGEPSYRARQIFDALYARRVESAEQISTLPKEFRRTLEERGLTVGLPRIERKFVSRDGTIRYLMALADGQSAPFVPGHPEEFSKALVRDDQLSGAVKHQQALHHIGQRGIKVIPGQPYFLGMASQVPHKKGQPCAEQKATEQHDPRPRVTRGHKAGGLRYRDHGPMDIAEVQRHGPVQPGSEILL